VAAPAPRAAVPASVLSFNEMWKRIARPKGEVQNARRIELGALPGAMGLEGLSILSSLRDQLRSKHDQVWLLLSGEGDLGLAASGNRLIGGTIVFVPAGAVHFYTTIPRVDSTFLSVAGPDLALDDVVYPEGERVVPHREAAAAPPAEGATPDAPAQGVPLVKPERGTVNGIVVHWDAERNRLADLVSGHDGPSGRMIYAGRYLTLTDVAVVDHLDLTTPLDQTILVIETPRAKLVVGAKTYPIASGHTAMIPGGTPVRVEGGTARDPVFLVVIRRTDITAVAAPASHPAGGS
jgi:hypothetical protein